MLLSGGSQASAQKRVAFRAVGGVAASYLQSRDKTSDLSPRVLPHIGLYALIPIEGRFSLKTGVAYEQKGWKSRSGELDTLDDRRYEYTISTLLHTIHIPLQICFSIRKGKTFSYSVSGGMSYSIFVEAESEWTMDTYRKDGLPRSQTLYWNPTIALIPDDSRFKGTFDGVSFLRFNTAFRAEGGIVWRSRYSLDVFWERGLHDVFASPGATSRRLGYSGISLGMALR